MYFKRGKGKINTDYGLKDIYLFYKCKYNSDVDYKTFLLIYKDFLTYIKNDIIENNNPFTLPYKMGIFYIIKKKLSIYKLKNSNGIYRKNIPIDWNKTKELWAKCYHGKTIDEIADIKDKRLIYHYNEKTNGYKIHLLWDKSTANFTGKRLYQFRPNRDFKHQITRYISHDNNYLKYYEK